MATRKRDRGTAATTRQRPVECEPCRYKVRMTRMQLKRGLPLCGVCEQRMTLPAAEDAVLVYSDAELRDHPEFVAAQERITRPGRMAKSGTTPQCPSCKKFKQSEGTCNHCGFHPTMGWHGPKGGDYYKAQNAKWNACPF